jgi:hypothetical protein
MIKHVQTLAVQSTAPVEDLAQERWNLSTAISAKQTL